MKYLDKSFSSRPATKKYRENFDQVFRKKVEDDFNREAAEAVQEELRKDKE